MYMSTEKKLCSAFKIWMKIPRLQNRAIGGAAV